MIIIYHISLDIKLIKIPEEILNNAQLNEAAKILPSHYNFEIHKTIWRVRQLTEEKRVRLRYIMALRLFVF